MKYKEDDLRNNLDFSRYSDDEIYLNLKKYSQQLKGGEDISWQPGMEKEVVCQGDVLTELDFFTNKLELKKSTGMVFSHTCDIALENSQRFPVNMVYGRIISFEKFVNYLKEKGKYNEDAMNSIKRQENKLILFLPKSLKLKEDSIVLLDRVNSVNNIAYKREDLSVKRLYSLNQLGRWILLMKLRFLYTRLNEADLNRA